MANPNITVVKKIYNAILKSKIKHLTCDSLSYELGIYPDVIAENLSYFDPLIIMDFDYDLRTLRTTLEKFISDKEEKAFYQKYFKDRSKKSARGSKKVSHHNKYSAVKIIKSVV